ncbi:MAG: hypothetical protein M3501_11805, partial [Actinomycetota bacterium]|nr:hypothetical protein [Actinomycetota bacterium]
ETEECPAVHRAAKLPDRRFGVLLRLDELTIPRFDRKFGRPKLGDTELHVLVTERDCVGRGEMGDRLLGPEVVVTDSEVLIAFASIPTSRAIRLPRQSVDAGHDRTAGAARRPSRRRRPRVGRRDLGLRRVALSGLD